MVDSVFGSVRPGDVVVLNYGQRLTVTEPPPNESRERIWSGQHSWSKTGRFDPDNIGINPFDIAKIEHNHQQLGSSENDQFFESGILAENGAA